MMTPDQIRLRLSEARACNDTGVAYDAQASSAIVIELLEEILPDLVALAEDGRRYREQQARDEAALASCTERAKCHATGQYQGNGVWIA